MKSLYKKTNFSTSYFMPPSKHTTVDFPGLKAVADRRLKFRPKKLGYKMQEVIDLTGLTRSQIIQLEKCELVKPTREPKNGKRADVYYPVHEVLKALLISDMRHAKFSLQGKFSLQQVRQAIANIDQSGPSFNGNTFLLTNGVTIKIVRGEHDVVDILRHNRQMWLLVSVDDQIEKLEQLEQKSA
jgi:DNA-binding transcriptional MerR regulator